MTPYVTVIHKAMHICKPRAIFNKMNVAIGLQQDNFKTIKCEIGVHIIIMLLMCFML